MAQNGEYAKLVHLQSLARKKEEQASHKVDEDQEVILKHVESKTLQKEKSDLEESIFFFHSFNLINFNKAKYSNISILFFFFFLLQSKRNKKLQHHGIH